MRRISLVIALLSLTAAALFTLCLKSEQPALASASLPGLRAAPARVEASEEAEYWSYLPIVERFRLNRTLAFLYNGDIWTVKEDGTSLFNVTKLGYVDSFDWSPDGKQFAYLATYYFESEVFIINADGSSRYQLTSAARAAPAVIDWHGSKIAILRKIDDYTDVKIAYIDMSLASHPIVNISPVLKNYGIDFNPLYGLSMRWSPDGKWIVLDHGTANGIASSDGQTFLNQNLTSPRWKNDSSLILSQVFYPDSGIYYYNPNTYANGFLTKVTNKAAVYTPNDQYIVYCTETAIMRMKPDNTEHITLAAVRAIQPEWAAAGDKLAYISWVPADYFAEFTGLHVMNADGSGSVTLVNGWASSPKWQP